jgi:TrmH family RNA methyltransferase
MLTKKIAKYIQTLNHKKFRDEEGVFVAEGPKVVDEFISSRKLECQYLCAEKEWLLENASLINYIPLERVLEVDGNRLQGISHLKTANKVLAVFKKKKEELNPQLTQKITILLDDIQDPGNLGTIIRIADWFGIEQIICSANSVDCYNPKVVQSTMGSLLRVNIIYKDLLEVIENNPSINTYAAALNGQSIFEMEKLKEGFILIGNESKGIQEMLLSTSTHKITIPKKGHAESLNAAVATGIIVFQLVG